VLATCPPSLAESTSFAQMLEDEKSFLRRLPSKDREALYALEASYVKSLRELQQYEYVSSPAICEACAYICFYEGRSAGRLSSLFPLPGTRGISNDLLSTFAALNVMSNDATISSARSGLLSTFSQRMNGGLTLLKSGKSTSGSNNESIGWQEKS
jgi:hypothetical protein